MIPKVIHYCWFGGNPLPERFVRCIDSWRRVMPDYEIRRWDESNYAIDKTCDYVREAYAAGYWAFVSDYARLDICTLYGGIYLDVDVEAVMPFDDLLDLEGFCGFEIGKRIVPDEVNLGLALGLTPGAPMGAILRDDYHGRHFIKPDGTYDLTPCPTIQTRVLLEHGLCLDNTRQTVNGLTVLPTEYFCPINQYTGERILTPRTHSIHHYAGSWNPPADRERRRLRMQYSHLGPLGANVASTLVAYGKHYGPVVMWKEILHKLGKK